MKYCYFIIISGLFACLPTHGFMHIRGKCCSLWDKQCILLLKTRSRIRLADDYVILRKQKLCDDFANKVHEFFFDTRRFFWHIMDVETTFLWLITCIKNHVYKMKKCLLLDFILLFILSGESFHYPYYIIAVSVCMCNVKRTVFPRSNFRLSEKTKRFMW